MDLQKKKVTNYKLKDFIIVNEFIDHFKKMIEDIEAYGKTNKCPVWDKSLVNGNKDLNRCLLCRAYFKKLNHCEFYFENFNSNNDNNCPCNYYTPVYLIGFLRSIITNSIKYHKEN